MRVSPGDRLAARHLGLRRTLVLVAVIVGAWAAVAAPAGASVIVYLCGPNLCQINPDGTGQKQLTTDGQAGTSRIYTGPSLSRDGKLLSFVYNGHVVVVRNGSPAATFSTTSALVTLMRPDGGRLAELESTLNDPATQLCTYALDGGGRNCPYGVPSGGWAPDGNLLISVQIDPAPYNRVICHVPVATNQACTDIRAADGSNDLYDPAVSPDGKTLAVTVARGIGGPSTGHIALYDYASGKLLGSLTDGTTDETAVWSPDGAQIAFDRGGSIYVVAADGSTAPHRIAAGHEPAWGGATSGTGSTGSTGSTGTTGSTGSTTALKLEIGAPAETVVASGGLVEQVACNVKCAVGAVGLVQIAGGASFKAKSVVKVLQAGVATAIRLPLPPAALSAIRKALAMHVKVVAEVGAVAQVGTQRKQATGSFVVRH